jgi:hypothetical protein
MHTAQDIEEYYKSALQQPFPYEDCRWVALHTRVKAEDLIPNFDWYDSNIAGYASSATRLKERSPQQLQQGLKSLRSDFFSTFPDLAILHGSITPENTPHLHQRLEALETMRLALLPLLEKSAFATKGSK